MPQAYQSINTGAAGDTVKNGIIKLAERTDTLRSNFSGTSYPTGGVVGQLCRRTDLGALYQLVSTGPDVWSKILTGTLAVADGGTGSTTASGARTALGLGTAAILNNGTASGELPTVSQADSRYTQRSNNLSDLNSASTARTNLGLGSLAILNTIGAAQVDDGAVSTSAKLANNIVSYGKMQVASAASKLIGSPSSGTTLQEISLGSGLSLSGSTLSVATGATNLALTLLADQVFSATGTPLNDLQFAIGAGETWSCEWTICFTSSNTNANFGNITFPDTPTSIQVSCHLSYSTTSTSAHSASLSSSTGSASFNMASSVGSFPTAIFRFVIVNGANAGNVVMNLSHVTSGTMTVRKNSYLIARKH